MELTDVPEDHPQYEAVRFAFENGLMAAMSEEGSEEGTDVFGIDTDASNADLLGAIYAYIGGGRNPEEALALLTGYGIIPEDTELENVLTQGFAYSTLENLAAAFGVEWTAPEADTGADSETAEETAMTRGSLAALLYQFNNDTSEEPEE